MSSARRAYIYLACIASLELWAWAAISLLRDLLLPGKFTSLETIALQIAIIVISLPIFAVHWLWAQRLAGREAEERGAVLRRLYLYGAMATFLGPFVSNAFYLLDSLLRLAFGLRPDTYRYLGLAQAGVVAHDLAAIVVLALLWAYHRRVAALDRQEIPEQGGASTVRRLYVYGFSAAGLAMTTLAVVSLFRWLMVSMGDAIVTGEPGLTREVARLAAGLPLWLIFWGWAQRLFAGPDEEERASTLRKVYLYLAVFLGVLATVTTLTAVLADGLGCVLGSSRSGGGDIREALSVLLGAGWVWAYHAYILRRDDAALAGEPATAAWVGRLYRYLVATIGLGAFLVGLAGDISFLIRSLAGVSFVRGLPEEAAWFTALILVGLPVWILPWRQGQAAATAPGPAGDEESAAVIRKAYLYFYLLVATLAVLGSGVYIVFRLVSLVLGVRQPGNLLADLGQAIAWSLVAVGVWLYHGSVLRADARRAKEAQARRLSALRVAVLDVGDGSLGRALLDELRRELPGLDLLPLGLTPEASAALGTTVDPSGIPAALAASDLIVGPWTAAVGGPWTAAVGGPAAGAEIARAVATSPATKVLIPVQVADWHWAGLGDLKTRDAVRHAVRAVGQAAAGEEVRAVRGLSAGAVVGIVFGALVLLLTVAIPLLFLFAMSAD